VDLAAGSGVSVASSPYTGKALLEIDPSLKPQLSSRQFRTLNTILHAYDNA
jgi:hypothetical protein